MSNKSRFGAKHPARLISRLDLTRPDEYWKLAFTYSTWLYFERRWLHWEMGGREQFKDLESAVWLQNAAGNFHSNKGPQPMSRAAPVLQLIGCDWRAYDDAERDAEPREAHHG